MLSYSIVHLPLGRSIAVSAAIVASAAIATIATIAPKAAAAGAEAAAAHSAGAAAAAVAAAAEAECGEAARTPQGYRWGGRDASGRTQPSSRAGPLPLACVLEVNPAASGETLGR